MWNFKRRTAASVTLGLLLSCSCLVSCTKEMARQEKPQVMHEDTTAPDLRSDRPEPKDSVPTDSDSIRNSDHTAEMPLPEKLKDGARIFSIYCSVCHDRSGTGGGMITRRGFPKSEPLWDITQARHTFASIREAVGQGVGTMPPFGARLTQSELDEVVLYVRALQFSKNVPRAWLDFGDMHALELSASSLPAATNPNKGTKP